MFPSKQKLVPSLECRHQKFDPFRAIVLHLAAESIEINEDNGKKLVFNITSKDTN